MNLKLEYDSFQDFANRLWPCLCEEGMWVRSDDPAAVGEIVDFEVMLADGFRLFHGTGQVIAVGPGPKDGERGEGMTLRFGQLDQPSRNLVRKVVSKHIGEGGRLFVLAAPATKVEVVGEGEAGGDDEASRAPAAEELVAPFEDLETSSWSPEGGPELTSFLRPSGRSGADDVMPPIEEPAAEPDPQAAEIDVAATWQGVSDEPEAPDAEVWSPPAGAADGGEDEEGEDESWAELPAVEPLPSLFPETLEPVQSSFADTQLVEPERTAGADGPPSEPPLDLGREQGDLEPLHSTVIPPVRAEVEGFDSEPYEEEPSTDEFLMDSGGSSASRWPWVVIGGLILGAGLYAAVQFDTPVARWFGAGAASEPPSPRVAAAPPARPPLPGSRLQRPAADAVGDEGEPVAGATSPETAPQGGAVASEPMTQAAGPEDGVGRDAAEQTVAAAAGGESEAPAPGPPATAPPAEAGAEAPPEPEGAAGPAPQAALAPLRLRRITWRQEGADTIVRLALEGAPAGDRFETLRVRGDNPRLVLKIDGVEGSVPRQPVAIGSEHVQQLRFGIHDVGGMRQIHVVADLATTGVELAGPVVVDPGGVELRFAAP